MASDATRVIFPDSDGYITLSEANYWYRSGGGKPLLADLGKIDFGNIHSSDFPGGVGSSWNFNLDSPRYFSRDGIVYGTIRLTLGRNNTVTTKSDFYDFDMQRGRFWRNAATLMGNAVAGSGTPYPINFYGTGYLGN